MEPKREVSVMGALPFSKDYGRMKYFLATEEERKDLTGLFHELVFRVATPEELDSLQGKTWDQMDAEEMQRLLAGGL